MLSLEGSANYLVIFCAGPPSETFAHDDGSEMAAGLTEN